MSAARLDLLRVLARYAVEFCSPLNTYHRLRGKIVFKTHIAVFVCLEAQAVHIVAVSNLSTDFFFVGVLKIRE